MTIFKIKGEEKKEDVLEFELRESDENIDLIVNGLILLTIYFDGTLSLIGGVALNGIQTDSDNRIIINNFKPCNETPEA